MEFDRLKRIPFNEFSEICTGDLPDLDLAYHYFLQPQYEKQFKQWSEKFMKTKQELYDELAALLVGATKEERKAEITRDFCKKNGLELKKPWTPPSDAISKKLQRTVPQLPFEKGKDQ